VLAAILAVPLTLLALALAVDAGFLRGRVIHAMAARAQRSISVRGPMQVRLLTLHPSVRAEGVEIDNPPWSLPGSLGHIGTLSIVIDFPWLGHPFTIETLEIAGAELTLARDAQGRANWQWVDPRTPGRRSLPFVRKLQVEHTHIVLADELRHLRFDGEVQTGGASAAGAPTEGAPTEGAPIEGAPSEGTSAASSERETRPLQLRAEGMLNGASTSIELEADPLATASAGHPYHYSFRERSADAQLEGHGVLTEPFFLDRTQGTFDSSGENLEALYQLAGVRLLPTVPYRLSGEFTRVGPESQFHRLHLTSGGSELQSEVAIDSSTSPSKLTVTLQFERLRLQDLGSAAAHNAGPPAAAAPAAASHLPTRPLNFDAVRHSDASYVLQARRVELGRYALTDVNARLRIAQGVMTLEPLAAHVWEGRLNVRATLDTTRAAPAFQLDAHLDDASLKDVAAAGPAAAPIDAQLTLRLGLRGAGLSLEQMADSADGSARLYLSPGLMRASLAELIGLDLRGLGLTLSKSKAETPIRCGAAELSAHAGVLTTRSLVIDTDTVLIDGRGTVNLGGTESIDLTLRGYPKGVRILKLNSSVKVAGTLFHPSVSIDTRHARLELIDVGQAKDVDCSQASNLEAATIQ
jgi:uncharacterized protein involved in outer membrane biogenesis